MGPTERPTGASERVGFQRDRETLLCRLRTRPWLIEATRTLQAGKCVWIDHGCPSSASAVSNQSSFAFAACPICSCPGKLAATARFFSTFGRCPTHIQTPTHQHTHTRARAHHIRCTAIRAASSRMILSLSSARSPLHCSHCLPSIAPRVRAARRSTLFINPSCAYS